MSTELDAARARLAETEALIEQGLGGPYAKQNLAAHRARVAKLEAAAAPTPTPAASIYIPAPAAPAPVAAAPARKPAPVPNGTREQRLTVLASKLGADERTLERAIANGTSPDEFAVIALEAAAAQRLADEIISA